MILREAAVLLALACAAPPEPMMPAAGPIELLILGQSNAVSPANGESPRYATTDGVWVNDYYCERPTGKISCFWGVEMVEPREGSSIHSNQTWIILADSLRRATGREVRVYNAASGGKATIELVNLWDPVTAMLVTHPSICVALWIQGEAEADFNPADTHAFMRYLIDSTRVVHPRLPWIVAPDAFARVAQLRIINEGLARRGPDIDSLRVNPRYFDEGLVEFSVDGFQAHADSWLGTLRKEKVCGL